MADTNRDIAMRAVGSLQAALQLLENINLPHEQKRTRDLVGLAQHTLNKAMLAAWEEADAQPALNT